MRPTQPSGWERHAKSHHSPILEDCLVSHLFLDTGSPPSWVLKPNRQGEVAFAEGTVRKYSAKSELS